MIGTGENDRPVKVGLAAELAKRLAHLQVGNPRRLRVLAAVPIACEIAADFETACKVQIRFSRIRGEWFDTGRDEVLRAVQVVFAEELWRRG